MKYIINLLFIFSVLIFATSCEEDKYDTSAVDAISAPANVSAIFDITQDNSGLVTIIPQGEGVAMFLVKFGDTSDDPSSEYELGEKITHIYSEGVYTVTITAVGPTGLSTSITQDLNVTFKAPENLVVTISLDEVNPRIATVSASADYVTVFEAYFGDQDPEDPTLFMPGEDIQHTYAEPGEFVVRVVAKSAGVATAEYMETIVIPDAADPILLPINFESFTVNYAFIDFGNAVSAVIDNPDASGINSSTKVGQSEKPNGAETWAGTILTLGDPIDFSIKKLFKAKIWSPKAGAIVKLKVENLDDGAIAHEVDATTTLTNEWEELQFDFSAIDVGQSYQKVVIFFDFGNPGDDAVYYFDDIKLTLAAPPQSEIIQDFEGTAPEFSVFGNIADIEIVANPDPSGANTTANTAKMIKTSGSEVWAGCFFETDVIALDEYQFINMSVWSPKSGITVKLKLENEDASITHEIDVVNTTANAWEELTFDFSGAPVADYIKVVTFFDFGNAGDDTEYYFDEITLTNGGGPSSFPFQDFEGAAPVFTVFGNIDTIAVISNPDPTGLNTTANVAQMTKTADSEVWAGCFFETGEPLDLESFSTIKVSTWSPKSDIVVKLKLENEDASITHEVDITNSVSNAWEVLEYDFSEAPAADYIKVVIFFDFGTAGDDSLYYFDEFELKN